MSRDDFTAAARSLALPIHQPPLDPSDDDDFLPAHTRRSEQSWRRRQSQSQSGSPESARPRTSRDKWTQEAAKWQRRGMKLWSKLTPAQKAGLIVLNIALLTSSILFLVYNEQIFAWLTPVAQGWRNLSGGWLILWFMTFFVSFPPMIGYSTCVTMAGFIYGMRGWFIISTATVAGSTCAFLASRTLLRTYVSRLTEQNQRFAALSLVLKHDGLKLLTMIRLCPLPYSLSNGAISTIPTVTWPNFALATALASPRLLLHVFVGSRIADLAENGDKMDAKTKAVSYVSIAFGILAGLGTGYVVYMRTRARAMQLEAEEAAAAVASGGGSRASSDDPAEREAVDVLRRGDDDISLHQTYSDDIEAGLYEDAFQDDFSDDEEDGGRDARERDVFDLGDGVSDDEDKMKR